MLRHSTTAAAKGQQEIANKYRSLRWCSFANSTMPKANTHWKWRAIHAITCLLRFNDLRDSTSLAWQMPLHMAGIDSGRSWDSEIEDQELICLTAKIIAFLIVFHSGWRSRRLFSRCGPARDTYYFIWRKPWCDSPLLGYDESTHRYLLRPFSESCDESREKYGKRPLSCDQRSDLFTRDHALNIAMDVKVENHDRKAIFLA
jgi:hypothetical protein